LPREEITIWVKKWMHVLLLHCLHEKEGMIGVDWTTSRHSRFRVLVINSSTQMTYRKNAAMAAANERPPAALRTAAPVCTAGGGLAADGADGFGGAGAGGAAGGGDG